MMRRMDLEVVGVLVTLEQGGAQQGKANKAGGREAHKAGNTKSTNLETGYALIDDNCCIALG